MDINIQTLGLVDYFKTWQAMKEFTENRTESSADEIWVCQHPPVYTLGLAGDPAHLLHVSHIPLVQTDRGGQITYHGPGQLVVYPLLDLKRYGLKVREYVQLIEQVLIDELVAAGLPDAQRKPNAPGVYIGWNGQQHTHQVGGELAKIAALGIKVRKGCTYHGLSLNVQMDLQPFRHINPCGYSGLETVDMAGAGAIISLDEMSSRIVKNLIRQLNQLQSSTTQSI